MTWTRFVPLAALAAAGCSLLYDPGAVETPPSRADVARFVEDWLDAYISRAATCQSTSPEWAETTDILSRAAHSRRMMDLWDRGLLHFDRPLADQCLTLTRTAATCDEAWKTRLPSATHPCAGALWGTKGIGQICEASLDCTYNLYCKGGGGVCPGMCAPRAGLGGSCSPGSPPCQRDLVCTNTPLTSNYYCRSRHLVQGASCVGVGGCAFGLYCDTGTTLCEPLPAYVDDLCGNGSICAPALYCAAGKCATRVPVDGTCVVGAGSCLSGARCNATSQCEPYAGASGSCGTIDAGDPQGCLQSTCIGTTCTPFPERGGTTTSGALCAPSNAGVGAVGGVCSDYCP